MKNLTAKLKNHVLDQVMNQVLDQVSCQVYDQVDCQVRWQVVIRFDRQVRYLVWFQIVEDIKS